MRCRNAAAIYCIVDWHRNDTGCTHNDAYMRDPTNANNMCMRYSWWCSDMPQRDIGLFMIVVFFMLSGIDTGRRRVAPYVHHKREAYARTTEPTSPDCIWITSPMWGADVVCCLKQPTRCPPLHTMMPQSDLRFVHMQKERKPTEPTARMWADRVNHDETASI